MLGIIGYLTLLGLLATNLVVADDARYLAFPKNRLDTAQTNATDKSIKSLLGDDKVYSYISPYVGLAFWLAPMTANQRKTVAGYEGVSC